MYCMCGGYKYYRYAVIFPEKIFLFNMDNKIYYYKNGEYIIFSEKNPPHVLQNHVPPFSVERTNQLLKNAHHVYISLNFDLKKNENVVLKSINRLLELGHFKI